MSAPCTTAHLRDLMAPCVGAGLILCPSHLCGIVSPMRHVVGGSRFNYLLVLRVAVTERRTDCLRGSPWGWSLCGRTVPLPMALDPMQVGVVGEPRLQFGGSGAVLATPHRSDLCAMSIMDGSDSALCIGQFMRSPAAHAQSHGLMFPLWFPLFRHGGPPLRTFLVVDRPKVVDSQPNV